MVHLRGLLDVESVSMPLETAIMETIEAAGIRVYTHTTIIIDSGETYAGYRLEAKDVFSGECWMIDASTTEEAAVALAVRVLDVDE